ncbi:MAG: glycoside hydrolase family 10 protein [Gemmatimonadaceae bacterium]
MTTVRGRVATIVLPALLASGCVSPPAPRPRPGVPVPPVLVAPAPTPAPVDRTATMPPAVAREFRGVWVATVGNIDWPSRPGLSSAEQQRELLTILDQARALNLNAVILQVRPAADALYQSEYEPWSAVLTGEMGRAPDPLYDPLAFAVREAHRRGLELHAWFNPFRALTAANGSAIAANHVSRTRRDLVRRYGQHLWLDPGEPDARAHAVRVIMDVVRRYEIDGVHLDDYFYPYRERDSTNRLVPFPDDASWDRYVRSGGRLSRNDWRRSNVDVFVAALYERIKGEKPRVKFGISPFGIWRPGNPQGVKGLDAYTELYADARKWLLNGWADYFTPQIYWTVNQPARSYSSLLAWWVSQNPHGRHIWPGNFTSRVGFTTDTTWSAEEIVEQIRATRLQDGASGNVHFSARALMNSHDDLVPRLAAGPYARKALVPASPWLDSIAPARPRAALRTDSATGDLIAELLPGDAEAVWLWVITARADELGGRGGGGGGGGGASWSTEIVPGWQRTHVLAAGREALRPDEVAISAVDRTGNQGAPVTLWPKSSASIDRATRTPATGGRN